MKASAVSALVRLNLRRDRRGALSSLFGIAVGVSSLVFFVALGLGISRVVREKVFPVDTRLVEVVPPQVALGGLLGGTLDQAAVDRLAALPGVDRAHRKMNVRVPAVCRYRGDFFGQQLNMGLEVIAVGVDPSLVQADVQLGKFEDPGAGQPIPAVAATRLIEIYNKTFAPARGLPQLSPAMLVGFSFPVELNRSFVTASAVGPSTPGTMQLVGVSERGLLAGVTIPLEAARRINKDHGADAATFTGVTLETSDPAQVPRVVAAVKEMGFRVDDAERRLSENAGAAVAITTLAMALLSALICLLAALNIAHALSASVRARSRELGVMRAVGASRADVARLVRAEALVLGASGGALGAALAVAAAFAVDLAVARFVPDFPFKPDAFFRVPLWLPLAGVALGALAAVVGAVGPSRRAARLEPARVLAG
ncbi:MAG: ABC transporter permease [Myxococcaceae bacterium]|nr:ABC transporter permease [Myxococcaceae bacterium]